MASALRMCFEGSRAPPRMFSTTAVIGVGVQRRSWLANSNTVMRNGTGIGAGRPRMSSGNGLSNDGGWALPMQDCLPAQCCTWSKAEGRGQSIGDWTEGRCRGGCKRLVRLAICKCCNSLQLRKVKDLQQG